jgi:hypothetical protein
MVKNFPVDYMHSVCLGVMRRLIDAWVKGPKSVRLSCSQIKRVNERLSFLESMIPSTIFKRRPKNLTDYHTWKATELRQFLLYSGPIVMKNVLSAECYKHFNYLSCAVAILVTRGYHSFGDPPMFLQAHDMLLHFVQCAAKIYGPDFMVYNVHSLIHLAAEAQEFGSLDDCSAFPFESYLGRLKKRVRSGKNPIVTLVRHMEGLEFCRNSDRTVIRPSASFVINGNACRVVADRGDGTFTCKIFRNPVPLFDSPCNSRLVGRFSVGSRFQTEVIDKDSLKRPAIFIPFEGEKNIVLTLLHCLGQD